MKEFARKLGVKKLIFFAVCLVLLLAALGCFLGIQRLSRLLPSQLEAERWQGGSDIEYAQISCFIPVDETVTLNQIGAFREEMAKSYTRRRWTSTPRIYSLPTHGAVPPR